MVDVHDPATLRGLPISVADIGDHMRLCHPLLSFEGDPALYVAHRLGWQDHPEALDIVDPDEAATLGTLLPSTFRCPIVPGEGVIVVGAKLKHAAKVADVELSSAEIPFSPLPGFTQDASSAPCWIGLATSSLFAALRSRLIEEALKAFDKALGDAVLHGSPLSEQGNAALLLIRRFGPRRRDDLAIRQLAGALQNGEFDLHRRLLIRFAPELDVQERVLDERVRRHIANAADRRRSAPHRWLQTHSTLELDILEQSQEWHEQLTPAVVESPSKELPYFTVVLALKHTQHTQTKHYPFETLRPSGRVQSHEPISSSDLMSGAPRMLSRTDAEAV